MKMMWMAIVALQEAMERIETSGSRGRRTESELIL